jgi:UDP-N-acetylmuramoyl-L-alanyl-D-glutamate--2,6-diaminopimelate ligase
VATELGIAVRHIEAGLDSVRAVRGRFEPVEPGDGAVDIDVIIDYAHKPDALEAVLRAAREITEGRVVVVVGAGGDRDKAKRPIMGRLASELADVTHITSDNPRSEDPLSIIDDMLAGIAVGSRVIVEPDRSAAIRRAIVEAEPGDYVVVAGKGHEATQTIGGRVEPFDDNEHAAAALRERANLR